MRTNMIQSVQSKVAEQKELEIRKSWKKNSYCLIFSRSENKWYDAKIHKIFTNSTDSDDTKQSLYNEWLIIKYKNNKKTKKIQRNCADIKPVPSDHILSLRKGSNCLIYSNILKLWCEGIVASIFKDKDGEWLRIKYFDTNEHKICDIQRYSKELQTFKRHLLWTSMRDIPIINKPWITLDTNNLILPNKLSNIIPLNNNEFITAAYSFENDENIEMEFDMDDENDEFENEKNGIYKYNIGQNRWELWICYPTNFFSQYHNICMDYNSQIIYIFNSMGGIIWKVYIKTKQFECIGLGDKVQYFGAMACILNNKFNIFYGNNNPNHLILDEYTLKMDINYKFDQYKKGLLSFGMVYNASENYFLFLGGYKGKDLGRTDEIWKYSLSNNNWSKLDILMPDKMQSFGSVITSNNKYVIIIGGSNSNGLSDNIYILNLMNMKWNKSKIICPFKGIGFGNVFIVTNDKNNNECIHIVQGMYSHIKIKISEILEQ